MNKRDIERCHFVWSELNEDIDNYDGPEIVMISSGYAEVCLDGDVISNGKVIANVSDN